MFPQVFDFVSMQCLFKMHQGNVCQMHSLTMLYELAKKKL